jgi:hypothetical protein
MRRHVPCARPRSGSVGQPVAAARGGERVRSRWSRAPEIRASRRILDGYDRPERSRSDATTAIGRVRGKVPRGPSNRDRRPRVGQTFSLARVSCCVFAWPVATRESFVETRFEIGSRVPRMGCRGGSRCRDAPRSPRRCRRAWARRAHRAPSTTSSRRPRSSSMRSRPPTRPGTTTPRAPRHPRASRELIRRIARARGFGGARGTFRPCRRHSPGDLEARRRVNHRRLGC